MHRSARLPLALAAGVLFTACEQGAPLAPDASRPDAPAALLAALECTAAVASAAVVCREAAPATGAASGLIVGGQGTYVFLDATRIEFTAADSLFSMDVTVRNLIPQPLGTTDGTALHPQGVRVFFVAGPIGTGGSAVLLNADGTDMFLAEGQPYFQWNEVLQTDQTSGERTWNFRLDEGTTGFTFRVYVAAQVRFPDGWVDLGSPADTLVAGTEAPLGPVVRTVVGTPVIGADIVWESSDSAIATVDSAGRIAALAPGVATITATSGARSGSRTVAVCPNLAVGEAYTAVMPAAASLCLAGGETGSAEYTYMPVNLSAGAALALSVTGSGIVAATGPPTPNLLPAGPLLSRTGSQALEVDEGSHLRRMRDEVRELAPLMRRPSARVSRGARAGGPSFQITPGVPAVGDLWPLNVASGCSGTRDDRIGRVVSVGQHLIVVADTMNPSGGFTTAQYDSIALEFDSIAHPVVVDNFGAPTDLDGNGRVVAFYTRAVNELSPPGSAAVVAGFFSARDLFSAAPQSCPRSNEGEMFYMLVPDPTGVVNGNTRTVTSVRGGTVGTLGHEFQHLVNAARRVYVHEASSFEEVWLNEGLSHITEELMFYRTAPGLAPRQNILLGTLTSGPFASDRVAAFNRYANQNFGRMRSFLQRPDTAGPVKSNDVLATRGAVWAFLRYSADRRNGDDATLWYSLANTTAAGKTNLQNVLGVDPDLWVRDFAAAMYADDAVPGIGPQHQITSWNFRSVYSGLGGFPLLARPLSNGVPLTLTYSAGGSTSFLRMGVPAGGFAGVSALSAGVPPVSPYALIVVRTK
jgi:hypothetical protein